ncbi:hypothetical protein EDB85DRAFT_2293120 [Lactarius pseudohatsudake]|nr:hypothetical protein EDB85DRAFT_2293120 [Lactarius pseudohatsudake]
MCNFAVNLPYKLQPNRPNRTLRWVVISPSRSLRQRIRARLPMQPGSRAPWFTMRVHIRKRSVQFKLLAPERSAYASQPYNRSPFFNTIATGACAATYPWLGSEHSADPHAFAPLFHPPRSPPQSPGVAVERLTRTPPQSPDTPSSVSKPKLKTEAPAKNGPPTAPVRPMPSTPTKGPTVAGKEIGRSVLNMNATLQLSLVRARAARTPIFVDASPLPTPARIVKTLSTGSRKRTSHPRYFAAHRTGFIFRRKVPVGQMMVWQLSPRPC